MKNSTTNEPAPTAYHQRGRLGYFLFYLLIFVLVVFPKGGISLDMVPITWGYILLGFAAIALMLFRFGDLISRLFSIEFGLVIGFPIFAGILAWANGTYSWGFTVSLFVSAAFMPLVFFILMPNWLRGISPWSLARYLRWLIALVSLYGLVAFVLNNYFGKSIFVPYLTTGVDDINDLLAKDNMRGSVGKLMSTYNNGNIFGISILILLSLADLGRNWRNWAYILLSRGALILTLSRTAWVGLLAYEILRAVVLRKLRFSFFIVLISLVGGVFFTFTHILSDVGYGDSFLLDTTMGGRLEAGALTSWGLISHDPFIGIREIVYLGILDNFGWLGLFLFLLQLFAPWLAVLVHRSRMQSEPARAGLIAVLLYPILCLSDGAYLLIPVCAFYWFAAGYLSAFADMPSVQPTSSTPPRPLWMRHRLTQGATTI